MKLKIRDLLKVIPSGVWIGVFVFILSAHTVFSQPNVIRVSGKVTDELKESLIGVSVRVKDVPVGNGTITDINGNYNLSVQADATLIFSIIGMTTQEIQVLGRTTINVIMTDETLELEEVVVTAFATQKTINVTGAIDAIKGAELVAIPVSNLANALVGLSPGISAIQTSGEPGRNAAEITIRGVSTFGGNRTEPLIVIDGIAQAAEQAFTAFNSLDPNDILGISILKDASSTAVYGVRAANGVIIVTTKRGVTGKPTVSVSTNFGVTKATHLQKGLSSYEWAMFRNEGIRSEMNSFPGTSSNAAYLFDERDLWKFQNNRDFDEIDLAGMAFLSEAQKNQLRNSPALYYGSHDLYVEQFNKMGPQFQTNVSISGGTDKVKYFTSIGYFSQESITNATKYYGSNTGSSFSRYNYRANVDMEVIKNTTISVNLSGQFGTTQGPGIDSGPYDLSGRYKVIMQYIYDANPFWCGPGILDNHLISSFDAPPNTIQQQLGVKTNSTIGAQNPVYNLLVSGTGIIYNTLLDNTILFKHKMPYLVQGLSIQASVNYQDTYNRYITIRPSLPTYSVRRSPTDPTRYEFFGGSMGGDSFGTSNNSTNNRLYLDGRITYDGVFGDHNIGLLFLGTASKYTMPDDSNNTPSGIMGLVGRVTYDYAQRYMFELNAGYNGTEQFAKGKRFGLFPAISAGWVPTNESFFPKNDIITFLKIRGSYGVIGSDGLGSRRYLYFPDTYSINQSGSRYSPGSSTTGANPWYNGTTEGTLGNPDVTWEKETMYDVGFESHFINNKLSLVFSYFNKERNNIITVPSGIIPLIYGVPSSRIPAANVGQTTNSGYELILNWNDKIGNVSYSIGGDMGYAHNRIIYMAEAPNPYEWMNQTGHSINQRYGLKSNGLYNTLEELNSRPNVTYGGNRATLGDVRYIDLNGDGIINNQDNGPIGYPNRPEFQFSLKVGLRYKGFDTRLLFNGTANGSFLMSRGIYIPFYKYSGNAFKWMYDGRWTQEKYEAGETITYPRATFNGDPANNNFVQSDYWIWSNDFFKLKNMELGYTFPKNTKFMKAAGISSLRAYINGNNIYTFFSSMKDLGIDPETRDNATYIYPLTRTYVFGFNIQF